MRAYIRHPSEFPIELRAAGQEPHGNGSKQRLLDVSVGGLCCLSKREFVPGERIQVHIPVGEPAFAAEATVAWCRPDQGRFRVGIAFDNASHAFSVRMVEQVCHIGRYHRHLQEQGREVSEEEAALEWIGKYAKLFPR